MSLLSLAFILSLYFFSCRKITPNIDYKGSGIASNKVSEEMLMAVKTSPDFLEGRMQTLIESKNPKEMFAFERDEIYLIPNESNSLRGMGKMMITGIPGVFQSGFSTPREKAKFNNNITNDMVLTSIEKYKLKKHTQPKIEGTGYNI